MASPANLAYVFEQWIPTASFTNIFISGVIWSILIITAVPVWIFCYIYLSIFIVLAYEKTVTLKGHYAKHCILVLAYLWNIFGRIWHGYELHGIENLPEGPGLIIYYHAPIPLDCVLFLATVLIQKKRMCHSVVDRFAFKLPGSKGLFKVLNMTPGTKDNCLSALKNGNLLTISPGGLREALFSDDTYKIIWGKRIGFAQLAIDAKVPIIPMFTQNTREGYITLGKIRILRKLYEFSRWPVVPIYGGFPVKFNTYLGKPIPYDPNITAEELAERAQIAIQSLIDKHQKHPGSIGRALLERFHNHSKND